MTTSDRSWASLLSCESESKQREILSRLTPEQRRTLKWNWQFWGRPGQFVPGSYRARDPRSNWVHWLPLAGRGWGKTRVGAETVRVWGEDPLNKINVVGPTAAAVRSVMINGPSGLMSCYPPERRPHYEPSKHLVTFPSGATAETFSADEPERLRGPQCSKYWTDEICAWRFLDEAWDNLMFGFRLGDDLRGINTTTPKPIKWLLQFVKDPDVVVTRHTSYENRENLAERFFNSVIRKYEGTRIGRQELNAEILEDTPGALWSMQIIDATRTREVLTHEFVRVVVAIDPAVSVGEHSSETGIVVAALLRSGHVLILDDLTCKESPLGWARIAIAAYHARRADRIVGEVNNGGDLVEANIRAVNPNVPFRAVRASRGKARRAEPVAALYEQGRIHHVGAFPDLETQMCSFVPGIEQQSPDRMDALVWAVTELLIDQDQTPMWQSAVQPVIISRY